MAKSLKALAFSVAFLATTSSAEVPRTQPDQSLQQLARQLEPYKDVRYALSKRYERANPRCEFSHDGLGVMGFHYIRRDLLGIADRPPGPLLRAKRSTGPERTSGPTPLPSYFISRTRRYRVE